MKLDAIYFKTKFETDTFFLKSYRYAMDVHLTVTFK